MGQVTTVGQAHTQNGVAGLEQCHEYGGVSLGAGVRLHVGVGGTKQFLGTVNGQLLGNIDKLATTVVALAGVAFGVFVGQHTALGFHHPRAGVVFGCDQLDVRFLTLLFRLHGVPQCVIESGDFHITIKHGCAAPVCMLARRCPCAGRNP